MPSRPAKFVSAIFIGILAGFPLATAAHGESAAAEGCLSAPWGDAPAGSRWRYHVDHVNKRNCWYLRQEGGGPSQASQQNSAPAPQSSPPPSPPAKPSVADARAELRPRPTGEPAADSPANSAANETNSQNASIWNGTATVATRWSDLQALRSAVNAPPAAATAAGNDTTQASTDPAQAIVPTIPFAHFSVPVRRETIWTLIAAAIGALTFAGIAAFVSKRSRSRRLRRRVARSTRAPISETTDDDRIILSDHPYPDSRDYRPRFGRVGLAAASSGRARKSARRAPRYAKR